MADFPTFEELQQRQPEQDMFPPFESLVELEERPTTERVINEMHPDLDKSDRALIMNFAASPEVGKRYLESQGFEVKGEGYSYLIRKEGESDWHAVDPEGFDWRDLTDFWGDVLNIAGSVTGGILATAATSATGPGAIWAGVKGAAAGGAASEALKQTIAKFAGLDPTLGEAAKAIGTEAAIGATAEFGGRLIGAGIKAGGRRLGQYGVEKGIWPAVHAETGTAGRYALRGAPGVVGGIGKHVVRSRPARVGEFLGQYIPGALQEATEAIVKKADQMGKFSQAGQLWKADIPGAAATFLRRGVIRMAFSKAPGLLARLIVMAKNAPGVATALKIVQQNPTPAAFNALMQNVDFQDWLQENPQVQEEIKRAAGQQESPQIPEGSLGF